MKNITIAILIILGLVCFACSKDYNDDSKEIIYGKKDSISLNIQYMLEGISTKAVNETLIENVNLYIVNELGDLVTYGYYTNTSSIEAVIYNKMKYTVYAIANAGKQMKVKTGAEIENLIYSINANSELSSASGAVLMSGKSPLQVLSDGQTLTIDMVRCLTKIVMKADYSQLSSDVNIQIKSIQLKNSPKRIYPFKNSKVSLPSEAFDGTIINNPTSSQMSSGISLYQFENMQGTLMPNNGDQKAKVWPESSEYFKICSYVQMEASYSSPRKRGNITYRFYLGKDMTSNFDVIRNTQHNLTVYFKGDGAVDENTWRVDNSDIVDLVTSISLLPSSIKFTSLGDTKQVTATILPVSAANKTLNWTSSNAAVAKVSSSGVVTAVGDGTCTITATSTDGSNVSSSISVTVDSNVYVTGVSVSPSSLSLFTGETYSLSANITPSNATNKSVTWSSSNTNIASVNLNGTVTAKASGSCTIYATSAENSSFKGSCTITVSDKQFTISPSSKSLYVGESFTITYSATPDATPSFSSNNTSVATIDANGKVTAKTQGSATISATANGITRTCAVTVSNTILEFDGSSSTMYVNDQATLAFSAVVPSDATITASSSNSNVEVISASTAGVVVKAKAVGTCTITANANGASDTYTITVKEKVTGIVVSPSTLSLMVGESDNLLASSEPPGTSVTVSWSSSNTNVATVDADGKVTAKNTGSCTIYATSTEDSSKKGQCSVTVSEKQFTISPTSKAMNVGETFTISYSANPSATPTFSSNNTSVATVDANGKVTAKANGSATITAVANGITRTCSVSVTNPQISFNGSSRTMYDGEQVTLTFATLVPSNASVTATASNSNVEVISTSSSGVIVKAKTPGSCTITATAGSVSDTYSINVQKLTITTHESSFVGYHHFNHTIGYTISPSHAASLGVTLTPDATASSHVLFPTENTVQFKSVPSDSPTMTMNVAVNGRSDVSTNVSFTIEEASIADNIKVNVNRGYNQVQKDLELRIAPHATMNYTISPDVSNSLQSAVGNNITINLGASTATFANPCRANGLYHLVVNSTGDDGQPITLNCDIEVYETIYLVGVSKTEDKMNLNNQDGVYNVRYSNEILAKWLAHPNSYFYSNGIVDDITIPFMYDGIRYEDDHTGKYIDNDFEFVKGEIYEMVLNGGTITFNGNNLPQYYHEFFYLEPADSNPWQINVKDGKYFYVYSRNFLSGFSNNASPDWKKIFDYVY